MSEVEALEKELYVAYLMLREALPLARKTLIRGGVELLDQESFWSAYRELSEYVDPDEEDNCAHAGITTRIEDLSRVRTNE